jgi:nucleoside-diphosphate-sugar epimerase
MCFGLWGPGFIGGHLVKRLKRDGLWVRGVDLKFPEFSETEADDFVMAICAAKIFAA